jgi:GTP cyclohydrolase II
MDAVASADSSGAHCNCMLGYAWDGKKCQGLGDCACTGTDCNKLTSTLNECLAAHTSCLGTPVIASCGASRPTPAVHSVCDPMDVLGSDDCNCAPLGYAWDGNDCVGVSCKCWGTDCNKLDTYDACMANHQACRPTKRLHCGSSGLFTGRSDACVAMDAQASGDATGGHCNCFLGFAWDGKDCMGLGDCDCVGADCDKLTEGYDECIANHQACAPVLHLTCGSSLNHTRTYSACAAMDATPSADQCHCGSLGWAWNGQRCVSFSESCSCTGVDCDKLTVTLDECLTAHTTCLGTPVIASCGAARPTPAVHSVCDPMDVLGSDDCNCAPLGYAWDGSACVAVSCKCWGTDCNKLTDTVEECQANHASCK